MKNELMTLAEVARYLNVSPPRLVRAYCNRGTLEGVPLPEPLENVPFRQRYWAREEVRQFKQRVALIHHHA